MALVAVALLRGERPGGGPGPALVLPPVEPADHRGHVGVAELLHGLGGERRADAAGAIDHHVGRLVGDPALDRGLEVAPGQVDGAGQGALLVLVGLAHVEHDRAGAGPSSSSASAVLTSRMAALAVASISRNVGTAVSFPLVSALRRLNATSGVDIPPSGEAAATGCHRAASGTGRLPWSGRRTGPPAVGRRSVGRRAGQAVLTYLGGGIVPAPVAGTRPAPPGRAGAASFGGWRKAGGRSGRRCPAGCRRPRHGW